MSLLPVNQLWLIGPLPNRHRKSKFSSSFLFFFPRHSQVCLQRGLPPATGLNVQFFQASGASRLVSIPFTSGTTLRPAGCGSKQSDSPTVRLWRVDEVETICWRLIFCLTSGGIFVWISARVWVWYFVYWVFRLIFLVNGYGYVEWWRFRRNFVFWMGWCVREFGLYCTTLFWKCGTSGRHLFLDLNPINAPFYIDLNSSVFSPIFFIEDPWHFFLPC